MNTMKSFYSSISSATRLHGSYLEALSEIARMSHQQARAVQSELAWQNWSQQAQETPTRGA